MSGLSPENIRAATGGRWLVPPTRPRALVGVGIDTRANLVDHAFVAIRGDRHDGHEFVAAAAAGGAGLLVVEQDLDRPASPAGTAVLRVDSTRRALADLARAHRARLTGTTVIGVTGSAGKTTTKGLIHAVLSRSMSGSTAPRSFNNDLGVPLTILGAKASDRFLVVEIGTNAPGEIGQLASIARPDIAVITTVGRAHLEGLGTLEDVAREKASILDALPAGGMGVINADAPWLQPWHRPDDRDVLYGEAPAAALRLTARAPRPRGQWIEVNRTERFELGLPGRHNALNALAAIAVARRLGAGESSIGDGLAEVAAEPMRMSVHEIDDLRIY
ncbi:MAG: Mur ligase family protein, partial [Planctomycetota bacterium]